MKFRNILLSLLFVPTVLMAQSHIGYTNETASRNNIFRYTSNTDQRLAMRLSAEKLQALKGKTIKSIRMAFGSKNSTGSQATLFLSKSLDGTPICQQTVTISSTNKLVEFALSQPYTITGSEEQLFVGCSLEIAANYGPFSSDFSKDVKNVFFAYGNGQWNDICGLGYGCPNIEIVTSEDVSMTDVVLKPFKEDGYVKEDTELSYKLQLQNFGTTPITSFEVQWGVGDGEAQNRTFTDLNIAPHATYDFTLEGLKANKVGDADIQISILKVNQLAADDDMSDNFCTAHAYFYPYNMERNVLLEVFTGQTCTNCPSAHTAIANALSQTPEVNVVEIAHHSGYVTDIFTMKEDWTLTGLYNNSTYAPAVMYNRTAFNSASSPVGECGSASTVRSQLIKASEEHPYVSINLKSQYDESTRNVTLTAQFYTHEQMPGDDLRYSIWLVQDNLVAKQNGGATDYVHNAVSRGCLTESAWGEKATFKPGELLMVEKKFTLPEVINSTSYEKEDGKNAIATVLKDMKIVVFVHQMSASDVNACRVFNCAEVEVDQKQDVVTDPVRILERRTYYGDVQGVENDSVATRTYDYCYNAENQLLRTIERAKNTHEEHWELVHYYISDYDALDRLVSTHSLQYGTFDYDEMGWLPANDTVSYEYDAEGRLVLEQHPLKYYTFEYTDAGQLLSRATWNINSITHYAANDLVETYSQFNAFGQPTVVTATSPTGKEWNEYIGRLVYDEDGNLIEEKHYSNETPAVLKYAEYWTYEDGILREHRLPTVYDDGLELENEREVFTLVDGNPDVIEHEIFLYNGDGTWSKMAGTRCIDEYGYLPVGSAPEIELVDEYDGGINIVGIQLLAGAGSDVRLYCSGILMNEGVDLSVSEMLAGQVFSMSGIKNGTYEFMAVIDGKASNIITYTFDTPLRAVTDVHAVSMRSDFEGNTYVTIGWTNPEYELMPFVSLPFRSHNVFFENMRTAEASTTDSAATQLEVNFGADKVKTLFVQTRYSIGHINSEPVTINLDKLSTSLDEIVSEPSSSPIYDLQGRHQARPTKGVYIQRGKKVLR